MSDKTEYIERGAAIKTLIAAIHNDGFKGESNIEIVTAHTKIGAILRWNWRQWRARRSKGEAAK